MGKAWERGYVVVCGDSLGTRLGMCGESLGTRLVVGGESLGTRLCSCVWREPGNEAM